MDQRCLTLGDLLDGLESIIDNGGISSSAKILWAERVVEGSDYVKEFGVCPGSILFGVEWIEDKQVIRGTVRLEPPPVSEQLC